ncbi:MAG: diguanylate cyclase [Lachnospiraceae bacterium]|nr:diguanylate cyclase [Lachnospiraceae bacterium]
MKKFHTFIEKASAISVKSDRAYYILSMDFENFQSINYYYGFSSGNELLLTFSDYLREQDWAVLTDRTYADHFFCFAALPYDSADHEAIFNQFIRTFIEKEQSNYKNCPLHIFCGICLLDDTIEQTMQEADFCRREAKTLKSDSVLMYSQTLRRSLEKQIAQENTVRYALEHKEPIIPISVNLSRLHILDRNTAQALHSIAQSYQIPPRYLEFELTETILTDEFSDAKYLVDSLRNYGYSVSIDDFGSGYAGITVWQQLTFDTLKLDRAFLSETGDLDRKNKALVPSIINTAHRLGIHVICEGVETKSQCDYLLHLGCTKVQGYYFSKPVPETDFFARYADLNGYYPLDFSLSKEDDTEDSEENVFDTTNRHYNKNLFTSFGIILASLFLLTLSTIYILLENRITVEEQFSQLASETLSEYTVAGNKQITSCIERLKSNLLSTSILVRESTSKNNIDSYIHALNEVSEKQESYQYISADYYEKSKESGKIPKEDLKVYEKLEQGETVITNLRYSKRYDSYYVGIAVPILKNKSFFGALYANLEMDDLLDSIDGSIGKENQALRIITDQNGYLLLLSGNKANNLDLKTGDNILSKASLPFSDETAKQLKKAYSKDETTVVPLGSYDGNPYFMVVSDLGFNGYHYVVCASMAETSTFASAVIEKNNRYFFILAVAFLLTNLAVVLSIIHTYFISQRDYDKYSLLEKFSDTVLFEYSYKTDKLRLTPNADQLLKIRSFEIDHFSKQLDVLNIFTGDSSIIAQALKNKKRKGQQEIRLRFLRPDDTYFWGMVHFIYSFDVRKNPVIVGKITDIDKIKAKEDILKERARHDLLTALMNKGTIEQEISEYLKITETGLLFIIDLDDFKQINDTYGHPCGDNVLQVTAQCIQTVFCENALTGRIGGDEFMIFLPDVSSKNQAEQKCRSLFLTFENSLRAENLPVVTISVGIACYPENGSTFSSLYHTADQLLYKAKKGGKSQFYFYENEEKTQGKI